MTNKLRYLWIAAASAVLTAGAAISYAQIKYGPWRAEQCEPLRSETGPGRSPALPQTPWGKQAQSCKWCREVVECPRIRDKLRHPIQCARRKHCVGPSQHPPTD
jgi:hypothetical protein